MIVRRTLDNASSADGKGASPMQEPANPDAGFLKEDAGQWVPQHFKKRRKELRRRYFVGE